MGKYEELLLFTKINIDFLCFSVLKNNKFNKQVVETKMIESYGKFYLFAENKYKLYLLHVQFFFILAWFFRIITTCKIIALIA